MSNKIDSAPHAQSGFVLNLRGRILDCTPGILPGAHVAGILNVTPDSFYDGGAFMDHGVAMRRAEQIVSEGAAIVDIGGASSRPQGTAYGTGAEVVSPEEEWRRIGPVVQGIARDLPGVIISVDTFHGFVARRALDSGAHIINDVTALRRSPDIAAIVAEADAALILMHSIGEPGSMPHKHEYENVVQDVLDDLTEAVSKARTAGVRSIVVDAGFGFGKNRHDNLRLIAETENFVRIGIPVMIGVSRKSSIGAVLAQIRNESNHPVPAADRLYGSLGATAVGVLKGATLVRTHDVRETVELLRLIGETVASGPPPSVYLVSE